MPEQTKTALTGRVKWFNDAKGYGFITAADGSDVLVHYTAIDGEGFRKLRPGQLVSYTAEDTPNGRLARQVTPAEEAADLTRCELDVLALAVEGCSSKEIAERLVVSKRTVDFHLLNVYRKLHAGSRVQALRRAVDLGLITLDPQCSEVTPAP
jgi:cold shock protein